MSEKICIYFIRHGIAAERGTYANDDERPLIAKGRQQTEKVAQKLRSLGLQFDSILSSPLPRAKETAEILLKAGLSSKIVDFDELSPMGNFDKWVNWMEEDLGNSSPSATLALVGHQPDLGNWAEKLVWGTAKDKIDLKKAGIIGVKLAKNASIVGNGSLFWLTSPKYLLQ